MSKGTLTAAHAERSDHHTMRKKLNIRSVQLIFSVIMFLTLAGLTGCQNEESEFLEKELEQEESGETADVEQKELKDTESGKASLAGTDLASETSPDSTESEGISKKKAEMTESDQSSAIQRPVSQTIYVDVCGAVVNPGVYELSSDSRVFQAIEKAGGYLPGAAASYLNRARSLSDGQQIYVPTQEEVDGQTIPLTQDETAQDGMVQEGTAQTGTAADNTADGTGTTQAGQRINLNTADVSQLSTLTGVGESKALAIIAYREENGPFTSIEDIMNVPGIKEGTYEKIKDKIAIE
nr:ComEA family DNA-binding protein [uncultured Blautia sp.]